MAAALGSTEGSIGYVEYSFAVQASLATAAVDSGAGPVQVSKDSASAAAAAAQITGTGDDLTLKLNYKPTAKDAYPIILVTYEIVCTKYASAATGTFVKNFLTYTSSDGQSLAGPAGLRSAAGLAQDQGRSVGRKDQLTTEIQHDSPRRAPSW